jgi:excisionase family DNA binding protein
MPQLETRPALTAAQAAKLANTCTATVYREIDRGNLRAARIGHAIRITRESFDAWMAGRKPPQSPSVDDLIDEIVAASTPLSDEQIDRIVAIINADQGVA